MATNTNLLFRYDVSSVDSFLANSYYFLDGKIYFYSEDTGNYYLNGILDFNLNDIISNNVYNIPEDELITQGYLKKYVFETNYSYDSSVIDFTKLLYQENQFNGKDFYFISNNVGLTAPDVAVGSEVIKILDDGNPEVTNTDFYLITDSKNVIENDGTYIYMSGIFSESGDNKLFIIRGLVSATNQITYLDVFYDTLSGTGNNIKNIKFDVDESNRINMLLMKDDDTLSLEFYRFNGSEFEYIPSTYNPIALVGNTVYDFMFTRFGYEANDYYCIKHNDDIITYNLSDGTYSIIPYRNTIYSGENFYINFMNDRFVITEDEFIRIIDIDKLVNNDLNYGSDYGSILLQELKIPSTEEVFVSAIYQFMDKYVVMTTDSFMIFEIDSALLGIRRYNEEDLVEFTRQMPDFISKQDEVQAFFDLFEKYLNNNYYNHYDETDKDLHRYYGYEDLWWCALTKNEKGEIIFKKYTNAEEGSTDKFFQSKYGIHALNGRTFYQAIRELAFVKDPYLINIDFIGYLARFMGYDFTVDFTDFKKLIEKFATNTFNNLNYQNIYDNFFNDDGTVANETINNYIRFIVTNLPYWKKIKGTNNMVETILMVFGISSFIQKMASIDYKLFYEEFLTSGRIIDGREISTPHLSINVDLQEVDINNDVLDSFDTVFKLIDDNIPINVVSDGFGAKITAIMNNSIFMYSRQREIYSFEMTADNTTIGSSYIPLFEVVAINTVFPETASENDGYIINTIPTSQDDELYKYINGEWVQLFPYVGYKVKNLSDGRYYVYRTVGDYNVFVYEEQELVLITNNNIPISTNNNELITAEI